jgi:formamidopyrimidine-DNA glycosylase
MFELPEYVNLANQMNDSLKGKTIKRGMLGNAPHKFVWYNRRHDEFEKLTRGKTVGEARAKGRWLFIELKKGYILVLGEFGGKVLYHQPGSGVPKKYHFDG